MQCSESSEWMSLHLDGLLDQEQALRLEAHLAACEACRQEWEAMRWLSSFLKAEPVAAPKPDFTARIALRLRQREARRRRLHSSIGVLIGSVGLWALAGAAVLLLFTMLWQPPIRVVLLEAGLALINDVLSTLAVLGQALYAAAYALAVRPTLWAQAFDGKAWLLLLGYAFLALGLTALWMRIVFQRRRYVFP